MMGTSFSFGVAIGGVLRPEARETGTAHGALRCEPLRNVVGGERGSAAIALADQLVADDLNGAGYGNGR